MMKNRILLTALVSSILLLSSSCGEKSIEKSSNTNEMTLDSAKSTLVNVSGELFSIPSPVQTAMLIKQSDSEYRPELLNDTKNQGAYETNAQKAMNLGVYGTDMAYSSLYEDGQKSLSYFKAMDNLAKDLGVISAISPDLINRLGANVDRPDSLMYLIGRFYEEGDAYLKKNERYDVASLVILGGWIESSYLTGQSALSGNQAAKDRLAQQKESSSTLLSVLRKTTDENFKKSSLFQVLDSLNQAYGDVQPAYTFRAPETDPKKKTTTIRSKTEYQVSDSLLQSIATLMESARTKITEK